MSESRLRMLGIFDNEKTNEQLEKERSELDHKSEISKIRRDRRILGLEAWVEFILKEENNFPTNGFGLGMLCIASVVISLILCLVTFFGMWTVEQLVEPFGSFSRGLAIEQDTHDDNYAIIQIARAGEWQTYTPGLLPQEALEMQEVLRARYPEDQFGIKDSGIDLRCWHVVENFAFDASKTRSECFLDYDVALAALATLRGETPPEIVLSVPLTLGDYIPPVVAPTPVEVAAVAAPAADIRYVELPPEVSLIVVPESVYNDGYWIPGATSSEFLDAGALSDLAFTADRVYFTEGTVTPEDLGPIYTSDPTLDAQGR